MGRGLSEQQKQVLAFVAAKGGLSDTYHIGSHCLDRQKPGKHFLQASNSQRASLSKSITRLCERELLMPCTIEERAPARRNHWGRWYQDPVETRAAYMLTDGGNAIVVNQLSAEATAIYGAEKAESAEMAAFWNEVLMANKVGRRPPDLLAISQGAIT